MENGEWRITVRVFRSPFLFIGCYFMAYIYIICTIYAVGCAKVNCGKAAREGALGYDLGAPHVNSSAIWYPVGAVIDRPCNGKWVRFVNRLHHTNHLSTQNVMITPVVGEQCSPLRLCVGKSFTRCAEVGAPYGKAI